MVVNGQGEKVLLRLLPVVLFSDVFAPRLSVVFSSVALVMIFPITTHASAPPSIRRSKSVPTVPISGVITSGTSRGVGSPVRRGREPRVLEERYDGKGMGDRRTAAAG